MQFVTKEQIDRFYLKFKGKEIVELNEMLMVFEEIFDYPASVTLLSEETKKKITKSIFMNPNVIKDLKEAKEDNTLIVEEGEIMRIVQEGQNGK